METCDSCSGVTVLVGKIGSRDNFLCRDCGAEWLGPVVVVEPMTMTAAEEANIRSGKSIMPNALSHSIREVAAFAIEASAADKDKLLTELDALRVKVRAVGHDMARVAEVQKTTTPRVLQWSNELLRAAGEKTS